MVPRDTDGMVDAWARSKSEYAKQGRFRCQSLLPAISPPYATAHRLKALLCMPPATLLFELDCRDEMTPTRTKFPITTAARFRGFCFIYHALMATRSHF